MANIKTPEKNDDSFLLTFAGWGNSERIDDLNDTKHAIEHLDQEKRHFLGPWKATAICGNDITSSCLYVSGLTIAGAGILAPFALALVSFTLYLFRKIYAEVGSALPLNGGTYTLLLNTTTKKKAALAATLTILSYIATAVISANEAIHYIHTVMPIIPVDASTILLLLAFAALSIFGVSESATVALYIFVFHIITLVGLALAAIFYLFHSENALAENMQSMPSALHLWPILFRGFLIGLLGISGFESSANYIEEQKEGVFPITLRNMWIAITVFNPMLCFLALAVFPISFITDNQAGLLARMGEISVGPWFAIWVAIDAFLVLSGAVLTSFVGITGLVRRMTLDRCLPQVLLSENKWRKTNHWIILSFLFVCISVYYITEGKIESLASVYTLSFLAVMLLFGIGNALLKVRRGRLPRKTRAGWPTVFIACILVTLGLVGNLYLNPDGTKIFAGYYSFAAGFIMIILFRTPILRFILHATQFSSNLLPGTRNYIRNLVEKLIQPIISLPVVFFTKGDNLSTLNRAALYIIENEQTKHLKIVHFHTDTVPKSLWYQARVIDELYPHLKVDLVLVKGTFNPNSIQALSKRLDVSKNQMFIGTPGETFPHGVETLGGVRVII